MAEQFTQHEVPEANNVSLIRVNKRAKNIWEQYLQTTIEISNLNYSGIFTHVGCVNTTLHSQLLKYTPPGVVLTLPYFISSFLGLLQKNNSLLYEHPEGFYQYRYHPTKCKIRLGYGFETEIEVHCMAKKQTIHGNKVTEMIVQQSIPYLLAPCLNLVALQQLVS